MDDVGLLTRASGLEVRKSMVSGELDINHGSIFENAVAQELAAHEHDLRYWRDKRVREVDYVLERGDGTVLPVQVR